MHLHHAIPLERMLIRLRLAPMAAHTIRSVTAIHPQHKAITQTPAIHGAKIAARSEIAHIQTAMTRTAIHGTTRQRISEAQQLIAVMTATETAITKRVTLTGIAINEKTNVNHLCIFCRVSKQRQRRHDLPSNKRGRFFNCPNLWI